MFKQEQSSVNEYVLKSMLDVVSDGNILLDWDANVLFINKVTQLYLKSYFQIEIREGVNAILATAHTRFTFLFIKYFNEAKAGKNISLQRQILLKENYSLWVHIQFSPIYQQNGESVGIAINIININDIKQAQDFLLERENIYKNVFDTAKEAIIVTDIDTNIISANPEACEMFGMPEVEMKKKTGSQLMVDSQDFFRRFLEDRKSYGYSNDVIRYKRNNGEIFYGDTTSSAFRNKSNQINVTVLIKDITKEKLLADELKRQRTLTESVLDNVPGFIFQYQENPDGSSCFPFSSSNAEKTLGIKSSSSEDHSGQTLDDLYDEEQKEKLKEALKISKKNMEPYVVTLKRVIQGEERWLYQRAIPIRLENGAILWNGYMHDITEEIKKNEEVNNNKIALEAEKSANQMKSDFLANISHEIRTPMNAILGYAELLNERNSDAKLKKYIDGILIGGNNLLMLMNDILKFSKSEVGQITLNPTKTNLRSLAADLKKLLLPALLENKNKLQIHIPEELPEYVMLDSIRLRQVLLNILSNASKFTLNGTIDFTVSYTPLFAREKIDELHFTIRDTGIGIASENLHTVFEPFKQIDSSLSRKYSGTGLGLTIAKKLTEMMGGEISVESELHKGTCFSITLRDITCLREAAVNDRITTTAATKESFGNAGILLIEDVFSNREIIKAFLEDHQVNIVEATNAEEALLLLKDIVPDLILLDIMMPGKDGLTFSEELRRNARLRHVPIVAISALSLDEELSQKLRFVDDFVKKPIIKNDFLKIIRRHLSKKNTKRY